MFMRFLSSAALGATVTASILLLMDTLIELNPLQIAETRRTPPIIFVRVIEDEIIITDERPIDPIDPPPALPVTPRSSAQTETGNFTGVRPQAERPPETSVIPDFGPANASLVSIIKVQPNYPPRAAAKGIEGYATVRFDVTPMGTVVNPVVIESSSSLFHKSAIDAALRFRFRAPVVDGEAQAVYGVVNRFVFRMEN